MILTIAIDPSGSTALAIENDGATFDQAKQVLEFLKTLLGAELNFTGDIERHVHPQDQAHIEVHDHVHA